MNPCRRAERYTFLTGETKAVNLAIAAKAHAIAARSPARLARAYLLQRQPT